MFIERPLAAKLAFAAVVAAIAVVAPTAAADVDGLTVLFRADMTSAEAAMAADARALLESALGARLGAVERTKTRAWRVAIDPPLADAEARVVVDKLRNARDVLYADPSARAAASSTIVEKAAADNSLPTDQIIVKYRDPALASAGIARADVARTDRVAAAAGRSAGYLREAINGSHVYKLAQRVTQAEAEAIAARIAAEPDVEYAEPDYRQRILLTPNDPSYAQQWHYFEMPGGVNAPAAWDITTGSREIIAAVIDTGYRPHADLAGRFVSTGYDMIFDHLTANDGVPMQPGNCLPTSDPLNPPCTNDRDNDAIDPGDWISVAENNGTDPTGGFFQGCAGPPGAFDNSSWHGTHVSGTIGAASNNASNVAGLNWVSKILPVRVLGKCGGYTSDIADGMVWASGGTVSGVPANPNPARVMNLSLGGEHPCDLTEQNAIDTAIANNTVVVIAAGNGHVDAVNSAPGNCNGVITVAAVGRAGQRASYSNYGSLVEIAAPGGSDGQGVLSTLNSGATTPGADAIAFYQGTSMATPHVVGVVSLMLSKNPFLTPAQVLTKIQSTARAFPSGTIRDCTNNLGAVTATIKYCGAGIIDAAAAVAAANVPAVSRVQLVADGTSLEHTFSAFPETAWYVLPVEAGKTYNVDVVDPKGDLVANAVGQLGVFLSDGVTSPPEATVNCTKTAGAIATSPNPDARAPGLDVSDEGVRCIVRTFPPASGNTQAKRTVYVKAPRKDPALGGGSTFAIRAYESTLYVHWNTFFNESHVELQNTSNDSICAELVRYPATGLSYSGVAWTTPIDVSTLTVPPHGAIETIYPVNSAVNGQTEGTLRIGACASPANFVAGALHTRTFSFNPVSGTYIYYFTSSANDGRSANSW